MFNPVAGMWHAHLAPPPGRAGKEWTDAWERYKALYMDFEEARLDADPKRPGLDAAIEALAECDYVHFSAGGAGMRVIQTTGPRESVVRDITDRRCVLAPPADRSRIHQCTPGSKVQLDLRTMRMRDLNTRDGVNDAAVAEGPEPDCEADPADTCLYVTRDPRVTAAYADLLWRVARQEPRNVAQPRGQDIPTVYIQTNNQRKWNRGEWGLEVAE